MCVLHLNCKRAAFQLLLMRLLDNLLHLFFDAALKIVGGARLHVARPRTLECHALQRVACNAARGTTARQSTLAAPSLTPQLSPLPKAVKIVYGSQTGSAMGFAQQLADSLPERGLSAEVVDVYEYSAASLEKETTPVVFVVSCFGRGEPTDSAKKFFAQLEKLGGTPLSNLQYSVFGLGSSGVRTLLVFTHNRTLTVVMYLLLSVRPRFCQHCVQATPALVFAAV